MSIQSLDDGGDAVRDCIEAAIPSLAVLLFCPGVEAIHGRSVVGGA